MNEILSYVWIAVGMFNVGWMFGISRGIAVLEESHERQRKELRDLGNKIITLYEVEKALRSEVLHRSLFDPKTMVN